MRQWREHNFPEYTLWDQALGVSEETGELCHSVLKMKQGIRGSTHEHLNGISDAVGDIIIYLTGVCDAAGLSLLACVSHAANEVLKRDWIQNPRDGTVSGVGADKPSDAGRDSDGYMG